MKEAGRGERTIAVRSEVKARGTQRLKESYNSQATSVAGRESKKQASQSAQPGRSRRDSLPCQIGLCAEPLRLEIHMVLS